jgi:hypothetical protein
MREALRRAPVEAPEPKILGEAAAVAKREARVVPGLGFFMCFGF